MSRSTLETKTRRAAALAVFIVVGALSSVAFASYVAPASTTMTSTDTTATSTETSTENGTSTDSFYTDTTSTVPTTTGVAPPAQGTSAPAFFPTTTTTSSATDPGSDPDPSLSYYIVKFQAGTSESDEAATINAAGATDLSSIEPLNLHSISVPNDSAQAALDSLNASGIVARIDSDKTREASSLSNDPSIGQQWALPRIGWDNLYGSVNPAGSATVAVLDTGVDASHEDLAGQLVPGTSILDGSDGTTDPNGHGTEMAGIVAAATNNGKGIAGVGYAGVKVMPVTVLGADGTGQDSDVIAGVVYAVDHGADVILMSFSNPGYSQSLQDAIDYAWAHNVVVVAATGNDGSSTPTFPAGDRGVVGVSNTDSADALSATSNYGQDTFLGAPGTDILTTTNDGGYAAVTGTSAAAAMVAGAAGLMRATSVGATNGVIVNRLAESADAAGTSAQTGNGRLNLQRSVLNTSSTSSEPAGAAPVGGGGPFVGPYTAGANFNATLQGQSCASPCTGTGTGTWITGNLANWRELDLIPVRVSLTNGPATAQVITVTFDHTKTQGGVTTPGIENLTNFTPSSNVTITSGPTLSAPAGSDSWSYSFTVNLTDANPGFVEFRARMAAGAHRFTGSSLSMGGTPSLGQLQISKPNAAPPVVAPPDLLLTKTGPTDTTPGQIITYTLSYSNKVAGTGTATGVQLKDVLPSSPVALAYVPGSCTPTCTVVGNTITWDLGSLAPGASGTKTYQATVSGTATNGQTFTNAAQVNSAQDETGTNFNDNSSSVTTTVRVPSISGTVLDDVNNNGSDDDGGLGVLGATVKLWQDAQTTGPLAGVLDGADTLIGTVTTPASGAFTFSGMAASKIYFLQRINASGYSSTQAVAGTGTASTALKVSNDQIKVNLGVIPTFNANNEFLEHQQNGSITGTVYNDVNGNGIFDAGDTGVDGVTVTLSGTSLGTTTTSGGGVYTFNGLAAGTYNVDYTPLTGYANTGTKPITGISLAAGATASGNNFFMQRTTSTSVALTSGTNPSTYGSSLTYTATVTSASGTNPAAGAVTFKDGATILCSTSLSGTNTATCTTSSLNVAGSPHSITAEYGGTATAPGFSGSTSNTLSQVVNAKGLTITANNQSKTYGQTFTFAGTEFSTSGLVNGDTVTSVTLTSAGAAATATVAGSPYAIVPSAAVGSGLANYSISYVGGTLTVNVKALTVTADDASKTYGVAFTFAGTEFTTNGLVNGDTVTGVTLTSPGAAAAATVAGSPYAIVPSAAVGSGLGNYTISYVNGSLTVNKRPLTVTASDQSKTYGQTFTFTGSEFSTGAGELVNGDTVTGVTLTSPGAAATATVAGSPYAITASNAVGTGLGNYTITYLPGQLTVNTRALTITANNQSKTYGQTFTFTGSEFSTGAGQLVNGDTVTSVTLTSAGAAATATVAGSPYAIVPSAAIGSGLGNYSISYVNGALTVNAKALTITANSTSKTYGQTVTFAGTEFTTNGLVNGDMVTSVTLTSAGAAATATVAGSPYAIVPSNAVGSGLGNYTISYVNGSLTVNKRALMVTANDQSKTYGQTFTFAGTEFTTSGLVNGDTVTGVSLFSSGAADSAMVAGSPYAIVASNAVGSGLGNYTISYVDGLFTVNAKALTITADNQSKTYGQTFTFAGTEFTTSGLVTTNGNGDAVNSVTLTSTGAPATATVAGSPYAITASNAVGSGLSNYTISYVNGSLTVNAKALTITATSTSKTYGQTVTFAGTEFTTNGLVNGDTVTSVTLTSAGAAATATVAGSPYAIVPSAAVGTGLGNYTITYYNGTLTVNAKALTITASNQSKTYGQTFTFAGTEFTTSGLVNGDTVSSVSLFSSGAADSATVAGSPYAIVASNAVGSGLGNYTIGYVDGLFTVNAKALTITANSTAKTYGQTVTFAGTEFSTSGLVTTNGNGDTVTSVTLTSAGAAAAATVAGSPYAITASNAVGSGLSNYLISYVDGTLTVNAKALTITANSTSKTYGQTVTFAGTEFSSSGLVNGDTVTSVTLTSAGAAATATVAGSPYAIVPSAAVGSGLGNYQITYVNGSLTVNKRALTVTADDASKTYGATFTFAGTEFTTSGLVNGDTVTSVTLTSAGAAATATVAGSPYAIVPSNAVGSGLGNYTISYVNGSLTVNTRALTITANDQSKTYGQTFTFAGTEFSTGAGELVNGDTVTGVTLTSPGTAATATVAGSPYAITASNAVGTGLGNYQITYLPGSFAVNAKALTITANSTSKTYGQTVTFAGTEFTTNGLVNGDTVTSVTLTSAGAAATATVAGSPYAIVPSAAVGSGLGNYTISYVNGQLNVNTKSLKITANSTSKTYGQTVTFAGTEFTTNGLVNGDTVSSVTLTSAGAAATATVAGSPYAIVPSAAVGTGLGNYTITYYNGTLTVNAKTLTITASDASKTYGQTFTFAGTEFTTGGLVNSDTITSVTLTSTGAAAAATVGGSPYAIVPSAAVGSGLSNYSISYVNGSLTVNKRALTVTANDQSKTYGQTFTFTGSEFSTGVGELVNGDTVTGVTLTSPGAAATATVVGSPYAITANNAVGTGLGNYQITYLPGSFTVNTKPLTITASPQTKTYGQTITFAGTEFSALGLVNSDSVTSVTLTSAGAAATATVAGGPYTITPSNAVGSGLSNYTISYSTGSLYVLQKALPITANNQSKTYGQAVSFAGTEFTTNGLVNGDTVTSVTLTSAGAPATATVAGSPYAIVPSAAVGSGLSNYSITYVNGSLTVNKRPLCVTANSTSKTYGQTVTFAGTEFAITSGTLVNSDTLTSVTLTSAGAAANATVAGSPYAIVPSNAVGTGLSNYDITYKNGTLTVGTKALSITASNRSKTYGDAVTFAGTEFTTGAGDLVNGDTVTSVALTSPGAAATASVGGSPYTITASNAVGSGLGNYSITYHDGTLTVGKKTLLVNADNKSRSYGQSDPTPTWTYSGFVNSENAGTVTITGTALCSYASHLPNVGSYPNAITCLSNTLSASNYAFATGSLGTLTINPDPTLITLDNKTSGTNFDCSNKYKATLTDTVTGNGISGVVLKLTIGTQGPVTATTDANGQATFTLTLNQNPGAVTEAVALNGAWTDTNRTSPSSVSRSFTVNADPNIGPAYNAGSLYTGSRFFWTTSSTSSTATLTLTATIKDNGVCTPPDPSVQGDVRKANVSFLISSNDMTSWSPVSSGQNLPVGLVDPNDTTVGTASVISQFNLNKVTYQQLWVKIVVGGEYTMSSDVYDVPITIAQPGIPNELLAGGNLANNGASLAGPAPGFFASGFLGAGTPLATPPSGGVSGGSVDFGGQVVYSKSGTNPQGQLTLAIHSWNKPDGTQDGKPHEYWVKSNSIASLALVGNPGARTASFSAKTNVYDITGTKIGLDGGGTMQFMFTEPGGTYQVSSPNTPGGTATLTCPPAPPTGTNTAGCASVIVYKSTGGVWFSSAWGAVASGDNPQTVEKVMLSGGTKIS